MINIRLDNAAAFLPGEVISGKVSWQSSKAPEEAELHLLWHTSGKGTEDIQIVEDVSFTPLQASAEHSFRFTLPESPYSFYGKILSVSWMLELVLTDPDESFQLPITVAPGKKEIRLEGSQVPDDESVDDDDNGEEND